MKQEVKPWFFSKETLKSPKSDYVCFCSSCRWRCFNLFALGRADAAGCGDLLCQAAWQRGQNNGAAIDNMDILTDLLLQEMKEYTDVPYVLFGHSMGGLVSYELTQKYINRGFLYRNM